MKNEAVNDEVKLSARLNAVADLVGTCRGIADIGSDHAYLPVWLIQHEKISFAVAGEVQPGPFEAARQTICDAALQERITARMGDGLQVVYPGEVAAVVLAGMGWATIRGILERSPDVLSLLDRLVFQPMTGSAGLRRWLAENGWRLVSEELVAEGGRLYEVLAAEPGSPEPADSLLLEIGPLLWRQRHPLLQEHLSRLIINYEKRMAAMIRSQTPEVMARRGEHAEKIYALKERLTWLQHVN